MKTAGERIKELRENRFVTIRELAKKLGISESQLSRIEKSETATVSSDILVSAAKYFGVSSDYILGLSPVTDNSMELSGLHLSEAACMRLAKRDVDGEVLSKLIEHKNFGSFTRSVGAYLNDTYVEGVEMRNEILNFGASFLQDHAAETAAPNAVRGKVNDILRARTSAHEIELTELRNLMMKMLRETKEKVDSEKAELFHHDENAAGESLSAKLRQIAEETVTMKQSEEERLDYVTDRTLEAVCAQTGANMKIVRLLKPLYKRLIRSVGNTEAETERN